MTVTEKEKYLVAVNYSKRVIMVLKYPHLLDQVHLFFTRMARDT